jgi:hypothetical protein
MYWTGVLVLCVAAVIRLLPMRLLPHGGGVDQWFWRAYIERIRGHKEFPPHLDQFKLDQAQWYPPLFPLLVAKLPENVFAQYAGYLSVLLDLLRLIMLLVVTGQLSNSAVLVLVAGLVYALTPVLTTYNLQLNPRGLGALFLDALCLGIGLSLIQGGQWWWVVAFLGGLILLTHKMTTQLFIYMVGLASLILLDPRPALLIPLSVLAALAFSGGFYLKVARAHWDIVKFWFHHWPWMGSNPILESPVYGLPGFESPTKFYRSGWKSACRRLTFLFGFNPWMPASLAIGLLLVWGNFPLNKIEIGAFVWLATVFSFAVATTVLPWLRCFGQGYLYGYNGAFPAALALGLTWPYWSTNWFMLTLFTVTAFASVLSLWAFFRSLRSSRTLKVDSDLNCAIEYLANLPSGLVMCFPQHWHDVVAYRTGMPVYFGGHGYGFNLLKPVFPRLMKPINELIAEQNISYLLIWPAYVNQAFLDDIPKHTKIEQFGEYKIYQFASVSSG